MDQTVNAGSHDLLTCFFEECESQFRFLEEEHGYLYFSGLMEYNGFYKLIRPYNEVRGEPNEPFFAVTRYERNSQAVEIFYGDKNYVLDVYLYPDSVRRFSMRDLISAAREDVFSNKNAAYLTEARSISESLQWFSKTMRENPKVLEPSERLIERATVMRDTLLEQGVRAHLETLIKDACKRAAEAFVHKNYTRVVEILMPYEGHLGTSDLKKLRIAREKIS